LLAQFAANTDDLSPSLKLLAGKQEFIRFGITDSALTELADEYQVLTMDYRLSGYLRNAGKHVLNFSDLRSIL
jgi:hypothetical protein